MYWSDFNLVLIVPLRNSYFTWKVCRKFWY